MWSPPKTVHEQSHLAKFIGRINSTYGLSLRSHADLHSWSIAHRDDFWSELADFTDIIGDIVGPVYQPGPSLYAGKWFPQSRLNFAENLLWRRDNAEALVSWTENGERNRIIFKDLFDQVLRVRSFLRGRGVHAGDRVAAVVPNTSESIVCCLAATSLGAVWSSCSPDFGVQGIIDRFSQIDPSVLLITDGYLHKGSLFDCNLKSQEVIQQLSTLHTVIQLEFSAHTSAKPISFRALFKFEEIVASTPPDETAFERYSFHHPLFIMFSSGTTGKPKCIVHSAGGTLLEHRKEHVLHTDLRNGDRFFYHTTCGWMMWNWLVSGLAQGATLVLFDGSPFACDGKVLLELAIKERVSIFGTSAKYIQMLEKLGLRPAKEMEFPELRTILSTGSPLAPENFDFVSQHWKTGVQLSSISGGTDILGCFALGSPIIPVYRGEIQCVSLGYDVDVFDDQGQSLRGGKGELVCKNPFPSMPNGFWNDPDGERFHEAYFSRYKDIWHHGDYVELTDHGGMIIYGRSDSVLNPGGVRIGTAEIYRQVESLDVIEECIAVGQDWENDVRIVLFVRLRPNGVLDDSLRSQIVDIIRKNASPFHVPRKILEVQDIPRTRSGKISEVAVREVIHGRPVKNLEALANPEALEQFRNRKELLEP